jgi:tetratricopeptide (TPR) repeat protein
MPLNQTPARPRGFFWLRSLYKVKRFTGINLAVLGVICFALYWPGLRGGFFFDDGPSILFAPGVRMTELTWEQLVAAFWSGGAGPTGRPLAQLSFALNHYFSGFDPWAFKLSNLVIHTLCGVMVHTLLREFFSGSQGGRSYQARWMALTGAALWMLHPLQLLPVLHVVQRMTSLSALFLLLALWLHIVARRSTGKVAVVCLLLAWGLAWPLSIMSKETGLLLPVYVLAWELMLFRKQGRQLDAFAKVYATAMLVAAFALMLYLISGSAQWLFAGYEARPFDATQRLLSEARVLWFYVGLAVWPRWSALGLYHDDFAISSGWLLPWTTLPAVLGWVAVLWLIWYLRRRARMVAFGLTWFLAGHLLESTILPLELVHEHRNYLPLLGLLWALLGGLSQFARMRKISHRALTGLALVGVLGCAAITAVRAHQYGNELRRTLAEVQFHPTSARAQYNLGIVLSALPTAAQVGTMTHSMAREHLMRATELDPNFKMALLEVLSQGCRASQGVDEVALAELTQRLRATLFAPGDRNVLYYAKEMAVAGQLCIWREQMEGLFRAALANPQTGVGVQSMIYSWLADYFWLGTGDLAAAKEALGQSLALNPEQPSNRLKWAQLLWLSGESQAARQVLLQLRSESLSAQERQTLEQLLQGSNMAPP